MSYGQTKYVVMKERLTDFRGDPVEDEDGKFIDREIIYVFPNQIIHRSFANKIGSRRRVVGAGFVGKQQDGSHFCHGKSESLGVESRNEDTALLRIMLGEPV
jgi:hypothetical protein